MISASIIYTKTLEGINRKTRRLIHQGGQSSGKTVNILEALATQCSREVNGGITTVTAQSFPHLKGGALRDFEMYVYPEFKPAIKQYHKTDHIFTFKSGSILEFKVFENEMAAHGAKRRRLFVNEANSFDYLVFFQLDSRSDQTIIDYNPSVRFWAHDELIGQPGNTTFISDHRHNPFLSKEKHAEIEAFYTPARDEKTGRILRNDKGEPIVLKGSYELWKVYARGITGNIQGVIFPNWEMIDESTFPTEHDDWIFAVDFGYTNDPTAIVKMCIIGDTLFIKELSYTAGLSPLSIKEILKANGYVDFQHVLWCDHDPDMIRQLRNVGLRLAMPARKGQGSINSGIEVLNSMHVKYTNTSRNLHNDRSKYIWQRRKEDNKLLNVPIDAHNHVFDATRYGVYSRHLKIAA